MKGVDPNSSNVSGQYQQQNETKQAETAREVNLGGKKAFLSKPKKWLQKAISVLLHPSKWGRSSKSATKTASAVRHTPPPHEQPARPKGKSILDRAAAPAGSNQPPSVRALPALPDSGKPALPPKPAASQQPQAQKPILEVVPQPESLEKFGTHFSKGDYKDHTGNVDKHAVKQHLRHFSKAQLRPDNKNEAYKSLPNDSKVLVQEVYAEKKVAEYSDRIKTSPEEGLQTIRNSLAKAYGNSPTSSALVKEFDRQVFTEKCSKTYQAISQTPENLQQEFPVFRNVLDDDHPVVVHYNSQRKNDPKITNTFKKGTPEGNKFHEQAIQKYRDINCDIGSCAGSEGHYVHANYVKLSDDPNEVPNIASQGPTEKNIHHFAHMVNDTESKISVCLVSKKELDPDKPEGKRTVSLGPKAVGDTINYEGVEVKLADQYFLDPDADGNNRVRVDKLEVNGKPHFRIYDTGWEDHSSGNPSRLAALSVLVEQLKKEPELENTGPAPMVVNCNAGVGRTGTFLTLSKMTQDYMKDGSTDLDLDSSIHSARKTRKAFVQTAGQYNALQQLQSNLSETLNPLLKAAGLEEENIYENYTPSTSRSSEPAGASAVESPATQENQGTVSTAKQFMDKFNADHYHSQTDFWAAVQQDINTMYDPNELRMLNNNISDYAKSNPEWKEATAHMQSLVNSQLASVQGPASAVDNINNSTIQVRR